jgi:hypothetical protein
MQALVAIVLLSPIVAAQQKLEEEDQTGNLQKATQNPVANLISVPLQNNTNFGVNPGYRNQDVLNIQPVIPIGISKDWNLRCITPIRLFSQGQAQIDHVYTWVCIIELFARSQALFPRSNRFPMGGVEEASTLQTHNTSRLRFRDDPLHFTGFIRFGEYDCFGTAIASIRL